MQVKKPILAVLPTAHNNEIEESQRPQPFIKGFIPSMKNKATKNNSNRNSRKAMIDQLRC